jgi:hypothetical protein
MNAETTLVLGDVRRTSGSGTLWLRRFKMFGRAFKSNAVRPPSRPALQHPYETLTFRDGTIHQVHQGQIAGEYMALSGIGVVRKVSLRELGDERCEYRFELNTSTDPVWRLYLKRLLPEVSIQFECQLMTLTCRPADLERSYERTGDAIIQANAWYAEEREQLISEVMARDAERQAAREMEHNRKLGLRRQFECLPL